MNKRLIIILAAAVIVIIVAIPNIFKKNAPVDTSEEKNTQSSVPLPSQEDIISVFVDLVDEGRVSDAVGALAPSLTEEESQKQAWGVQLNAFESLSLKSIEPAGENVFKVVLEVTMKPESEKALIPYYGYFNGENIRWIALEKVDNLWKISEIATGP
jgi:hypothetical protein